MFFKPFIAMILMGLVAACQTTSGTRYLDTSCEAFKAISYSKSDTEQTKAEIRSHNAAYDAICPSPKG